MKHAIKPLRIALGAAAMAALTITGGTALAQKLPSQLTWTAYDVGSGGYNQAVAIGNALKNKMGVTLRVLPGKNDVSRTVPLREGKVPFSANGVGGTYMAQEGMYEFGGKGCLHFQPLVRTLEPHVMQAREALLQEVHALIG